MEYTPVILCDSLANTTLNENSAEKCSDWLTNSCFNCGHKNINGRNCLMGCNI